MAHSETMHFFFGKDNPLSNWYLRDFVVKDIHFCCVEQMMMFCKAMLFGDLVIAEKIMATRDPMQHKRLGRQVRGYAEHIWVEKREHYVFTGAYHKFSQHEDLRAHLLSTYPKELVEASKYDQIWGVGLDEDSPAIHHHRLWRGLNLCGKAVERVRDTLIRELV